MRMVAPGRVVSAAHLIGLRIDGHDLVAALDRDEDLVRNGIELCVADVAT